LAQFTNLGGTCDQALTIENASVARQEHRQ